MYISMNMKKTSLTLIIIAIIREELFNFILKTFKIIISFISMRMPRYWQATTLEGLSILFDII